MIINTGILPKKMNPGDKYVPIQDVSVHFRGKLQEANEFLD